MTFTGKGGELEMQLSFWQLALGAFDVGWIILIGAALFRETSSAVDDDDVPGDW